MKRPASTAGLEMDTLRAGWRLSEEERRHARWIGQRRMLSRLFQCWGISSGVAALAGLIGFDWASHYPATFSYLLVGAIMYVITCAGATYYLIADLVDRKSAAAFEDTGEWLVISIGAPVVGSWILAVALLMYFLLSVVGGAVTGIRLALPHI